MSADPNASHIIDGSFVEDDAGRPMECVYPEEIFGPIMSVPTFRCEKGMIARASETEFGRSAGVLIRDLSSGERGLQSDQKCLCGNRTGR